MEARSFGTNLSLTIKIFFVVIAIRSRFLEMRIGYKEVWLTYTDLPVFTVAASRSLAMANFHRDLGVGLAVPPALVAYSFPTQCISAYCHVLPNSCACSDYLFRVQIRMHTKRY